jgi:soluble lytic murein transglycosylase-like protein
VAFTTVSFLIVTWLAATAALPAAAPPAGQDPAALFREARQAFREDGNDVLLETLRGSSPLWAARVSLVRAAQGEKSGSPAGQSLGLPDVDGWLAVRNDPKADAATLARFAASLPFGPVAIEATGEASASIRTAAEKRLVGDLALRFLGIGPCGPRATTILLVARLRAGADVAERRAVMSELVSAVPDALEREPSRFVAEEARLFREMAHQAPFPARAIRARAVLALHPDEAASLVQRGAGGRSEEEALLAAEILLATGHSREAEREVAKLERSAAPGLAESARALSAAAALQRIARSERPRGGKRSRSGARASRIARSVPERGPGAQLDFDRLTRDAEALLAKSLRPAVRHRLLLELLRAARRADRADVVRSAAPRLVELDPGGWAGSDELFLDAFAAYRSSDPELAGASARAFAEISSLYRNVSVRRRAVYWEARALQKRGDPSSGSLFASLLSGTSPDVYGRWAADVLGVEPVTAGPVGSGDDPSPDSFPLAPSREYLAAGLDGLAELAAELEGSLDRLFIARIASERGDYRRTASLLKALHPSLGTPEEGGVPLQVRELFYPRAYLGVVREEGRRAGLSPALLCGLIRQESLFQARIVSKAGAVGLMQVMPATGRLVSRREGDRGRPDLTRPEENVRLGALFFRRLLEQFDGDVVAALAAYNAGPSRSARWKTENANLSPDEWVEAIPFSETRDYVKRVLFFSGAYAALYGLPDPPGPPRLTAPGGGLRPLAAPAGPSRPFGGR